LFVHASYFGEARDVGVVVNVPDSSEERMAMPMTAGAQSAAMEKRVNFMVAVVVGSMMQK